jgi:hypothetical protein
MPGARTELEAKILTSLAFFPFLLSYGLGQALTDCFQMDTDRISSPYAAACAMDLAWKALGKKSRPLLTRYAVKNLGSRLRFSIRKAEELLGWRPPLSYEEGFRRTIEWLKRTEPGLWKQK